MLLAALNSLTSAALAPGGPAGGYFAAAFVDRPHVLKETDLPALVCGPRRFRSFRFNESGELLALELTLTLWVATPIADGTAEADAALGALFPLLAAQGFVPREGAQVEAAWGEREVILSEVNADKRIAP